MTLQIDQERRERLASRLKSFFLEEFDEELSPFRAGEVLDFCIGILGPQIYNQAVQDARGFMQQRLDDLEGEVYEPESRP